MKIEKAQEKVPTPVSFRIPIDTHLRFKVLVELLNKSQAELLTDWVSQAYEEAQKQYPKKEIASAEVQVRKKKKKK